MKYALGIPAVLILLLAALFAYQRLRLHFSTRSPTCLEVMGDEGIETFTAQYSPDEIATIVEGAGVVVPPGISVPHGYARTPAPLRTPSLHDAVHEYLSSPARLRRYAHPCTPTVSPTP